MNNIGIIIPAHIKDIKQLKLLQRCIKSLLNQTVSAKIYLSISYEDNKLNKLYISKYITIDKQEKQLYQLEHIKYLIDKYGDNHNFWLYCDHDDQYNISRIEKFTNQINCDMGKYEITFVKELADEYWSLCTNIKYIKLFFKIIEDNNKLDYLKNKYCDVLLFSFFKTLKGKYILDLMINEKLYYYNKKNNNSVLHTHLNNFNKKEQSIDAWTAFKMMDGTYIHSLGKDINQLYIEILANCKKYHNEEEIKKLELEYKEMKQFLSILYNYNID